MSNNNSIFVLILFFICILGACKTKSPLIKKITDYNYSFTNNDIACIITFFSQDTSYLSFANIDSSYLTKDSLIIQFNQEKKCFYKYGFTIYKLSSYHNTYTKFYYTYMGKIRGIERIVNGEVVSKGIVNNDTIITQVFQVSDPFW